MKWYQAVRTAEKVQLYAKAPVLRHTYITHLLFRNIFTAAVLTEKLSKWMTAPGPIPLLSKNSWKDMDHEFGLKVAAKYFNYLHVYCGG